MADQETTDQGNPQASAPQDASAAPVEQPSTPQGATEAVPAAQPTPPAPPAPQAQREPQSHREPQRGRGGQRQGGRGRGGPRRDDRGGDESGIESSVVRIYRCSKVVKGGRTFSFGALVVAGDRKGNVGIGYGKANEVPPAVEKATKDARKSMFKVNLKGTTVPHVVKGTSGASTVVLVPARPGTGVTAGKSVRPCLELSGITDILTKAYGSTAAKNLVKATIDALRQLRSRESVEERRGVQLEKGSGELVST
jgi:small subunit ribosomal protein S5